MPYKDPETARSLDATNLLCAVMDMAGLREVTVTDDILRKVGSDTLQVITRDMDPALPRGAYRLVVHQQRSPIVVPGRVVSDAALRRGPHEIGDGR